MTTKRLPSFKTPPVHEVVASIRFQPTNLLTVHVGMLWQSIREQYPIVDELSPIADETDPFQVLQIPPLRRVRMATTDQQYSIQIQGNRFVGNWRKSVPKLEYPRFGPIYARFKEEWKTVSELLGRLTGSTLESTGFELTYINEFVRDEKSLMTPLEAMINVCKWSDLKRELLPEPSTFNFGWMFDLPQQMGRLAVSLNPARRSDGVDVILFSFKCSGPSSNKYTQDDWFSLAHEWIVQGFADLTTEEAHAKWKRE